MIYGDLIVRVENDVTDRVGIRTLILSQRWQASRWPMELTELEAERPTAPAVPAGMEIAGSETRPAPGGLRTFWTYWGVNGNGKDITFKTRGKSPDYRLEEGFSQVPIALHPRIKALMETYGGYALDGNIAFPPTLNSSGTPSIFGVAATGAATVGAFQKFTSGTAGGAGTTGASYGSSGAKNPLYGYTEYFRPEGTYTYRYVAQRESEIPDIAGRIFTAAALPGMAKAFAGRNYLGVGAPYRRKGPVLDVQETYWLSGEGDWPRQIYK